MGKAYGLTAEEIEAAACGEGYSQFARNHHMLLNSRERRRFKEAKEVDYVILIGRKRKNLHNAYYLWCSAMDKPCVSVRRKRKYAEVDLIIPDPDGIPPEYMDQIHKVMQEETASGGTVLLGASTDAYSERIPKERAETVAQRIYEIAINGLNARQGKQDYD